MNTLFKRIIIFSSYVFLIFILMGCNSKGTLDLKVKNKLELKEDYILTFNSFREIFLICGGLSGPNDHNTLVDELNGVIEHTQESNYYYENDFKSIEKQKKKVNELAIILNESLKNKNLITKEEGSNLLKEMEALLYMQLDYLEKYKDKVVIQPNSDEGKSLAKIMEISDFLKKQENTNNKDNDRTYLEQTNLNNKENSEIVNNALNEVLYFYNKLIYSLEFYMDNPNNIVNNAYDIEKDIIYIEMSIEEKENFINKNVVREISNIINEGYSLVKYIENNDLTNKSYIEKVLIKFKDIIKNIEASKDTIIKIYKIDDSPYDPNWKQY